MITAAEAIAEVLRGREPRWCDGVAEAAAVHGVAPLLHHLTRDARFLADMRAAKTHEVVRAARLDELLDALAGIDVLVIKGAALGRTLYASPWLRPRCDSDLLVRRRDLERVAAVLRALGYAEEPSSGGELASTQRAWSLTDSLGIRHVVDLHWAISNRPRVARAFAFDDLWRRSVRFGAGRTLSMSDALILATTHMTAHHDGEERLIWLYDIHLLVAALGDKAVAAAVDDANSRGIGGEVAWGLHAAHRWVATPLPQRAPHPAAVRGPLAMLWDDVRCTRGGRNKLRLLAEHVFPPAEHVARKYAVRRRAFVGPLYARRAASAAMRMALCYIGFSSRNSEVKGKPIAR